MEIEMKNELLKNENTLLTSIETLSLFNKVTGINALSDNEGNFIIREVGTACQKLINADADLSRMFQAILNKTIKIENSFYCPTSITSLGNLQSIGGNADFKNSRITSLDKLQSIGGNADFRHSRITSLGDLRNIGRDADFRYSLIISLDKLQSIGGTADFEDTSITSLGDLKSIGGDADFRYSRITSLDKLHSVGGTADFEDSSITSLGDLRSIGGDAYFNSDSIISLGNLQNIGGDVDFMGSPVISLGNLRSVGGDAYFIDSQDNAKLLKTIKTFDEEAIKIHRRIAGTLKEVLSKFPSIIGGVKLSVKQRKALATRETIQISGITDKFGRKFTSEVRWDVQENKPKYDNIKPIKEPIKKESPGKTSKKKAGLRM
jgi:hypothetical protein